VHAPEAEGSLLDGNAAGSAVHVLKDDLSLFGGHVLSVIKDDADSVVS
jgi:hypothetical protein